MKRIQLLPLFLISTSAFSQSPLIKQWDYRFGGDWYDNLFAFHQTADGGDIRGGFSGSGVSGDKTPPLQGLDDYFIKSINL